MCARCSKHITGLARSLILDGRTDYRRKNLLCFVLRRRLPGLFTACDLHSVTRVVHLEACAPGRTSTIRGAYPQTVYNGTARGNGSSPSSDNPLRQRGVALSGRAGTCRLIRIRRHSDKMYCWARREPNSSGNDSC